MLRLALFALLLLLVLSPAALAGETKEFKDHNFKLTLPDGWQWAEVNAEHKKAGYVARTVLRGNGAMAIATIRVVPANDLSLEELTAEVRQGLPQSLKSNQGTKVTKGTLSGLEGTQVIVKGINQNDQKTLFRAYTILAGGKFHQVLFLCLGGAETKMARGIDALRRGYRLLKGAGPQEAAPDEEAFEEEEEDDWEGPTDGGGSAGDWPENGPKKEGDTLVFPTHNLRWTMPAGSMFEWGSPYEDEAEALPERGARVMVRAEAAQERKGAKETEPQHNVARVLLLVGNEPPGFNANGYATGDSEKNWVIETFFDDVNMALTKSYEDVDIGNHTGAALKMGGRKENAAVFVWCWYTSLRGKFYIWRVIVAGGSEANAVFKTDIQKLMKGIEFPEIEEPIQGPLGVALVPASGKSRANNAGAEKKIMSVGFSAKKPKGVGEIRYMPEERPPNWQNPTPNFRLAWEARDEGGQHFLYFDVQTYPIKAGQKDVEKQLLQQRVGQWTQVAEGAETISKGKEAGFKDKWGKGKGLGYEFKGFYRNKPVMERGWIVVYKRYVYWFRAQYGGEGAEKKYSKLFKKIKKSIKF